MPKKPPRHNPRGRELRTVHNAGNAADALLRRITQRSGVVLPRNNQGAESTDWIALLSPLLPENVRPHLLQVLEKEDELVLMVDAAVWAGRVKLALPDLAAAGGSRKLVVKIDPRGARGR